MNRIEFENGVMEVNRLRITQIIEDKNDHVVTYFVIDTGDGSPVMVSESTGKAFLQNAYREYDQIIDCIARDTLDAQ